MGGHTGMHKGTAYFVCEKGHGVLVEAGKVKLVKPTVNVAPKTIEGIKQSWIGYVT